jgi:hypothetical protein
VREPVIEHVAAQGTGSDTDTPGALAGDSLVSQINRWYWRSSPNSLTVTGLGRRWGTSTDRLRNIGMLLSVHVQCCSNRTGWNRATVTTFIGKDGVHMCLSGNGQVLISHDMHNILTLHRARCEKTIPLMVMLGILSRSRWPRAGLTDGEKMALPESRTLILDIATVS